MRYLSLFIPLLILGSCSLSTAGLTIPARQTFVLGEYERGAYSTKLNNRGEQDVVAQLIDKRTGAVAQSRLLPAGKRISLRIPDGQQVHLINDNVGDAQIKVGMSEKVEGMRYLKPGETFTPKATLPTAAKPEIEDIAKPFRLNVTIPAGGEQAVGRVADAPYAFELRNGVTKGQLKVSIRNQAGEQTQGFGLGPAGKAQAYVRTGETLFLVDESGKERMMRLRTSRAIE